MLSLPEINNSDKKDNFYLDYFSTFVYAFFMGFGKNQIFFVDDSRRNIINRTLT